MAGRLFGYNIGEYYGIRPKQGVLTSCLAVMRSLMMVSRKEYRMRKYTIEEILELLDNEEFQQWFKDTDRVTITYRSLTDKINELIPEEEIDAPYELTEKQKAFVRAVEAEGLEVYYTYSGRGMFGRQCPAVNLDGGESFGFRGSSQDSMGLGTVIYMP